MQQNVMLNYSTLDLCRNFKISLSFFALFFPYDLSKKQVEDVEFFCLFLRCNELKMIFFIYIRTAFGLIYLIDDNRKVYNYSIIDKKSLMSSRNMIKHLDLASTQQLYYIKMYSFFIDLFQEKSYNNILLSNKQFLSTTINTCSLFIACQDIGLYINIAKL